MIYKISMILFSNKFFYNFFNKIYKLTTHILGFSNYDFIYSGEKYLIKSIFKDLDFVIDVGAGEGTFFELINTFKRNQFVYHGFEPNPDSFRVLESKLKNSGFRKFKIYNKAVGNKSEKLDLYFYKNKLKSNHSSLNKDTFDILYQEQSDSIKVDVIKLDSQIENFKDVNLIKIDTEGNLSKVLSGAQNIMKHKSLKYILFELNTNEYIQGITFHEISNLIGNDFKFYKLLKKGLLEISDKDFLIHEYGCNILAKRIIP